MREVIKSVKTIFCSGQDLLIYCIQYITIKLDILKGIYISRVPAN